jgi:hypothetical protein
MGRRDRDREHDELTRLLRDGDPAGDGSEPSADEFARMRRAVAVVSREPRPAWLAVPALALATILALAVAAWLLTRSEGDPRSAGPVSPDVARDSGASEAVAEADIDDPDEIFGEGVLPEGTITVAQGPPPSDPPPLDPPEAVPAAVKGSPAEAVSSRTVRFTTPNGTRIVWVLNPNLDI